jgi:hypothetical protein
MQEHIHVPPSNHQEFDLVRQCFPQQHYIYSVVVLLIHSYCYLVPFLVELCQSCHREELRDLASYQQFHRPNHTELRAKSKSRQRSVLIARYIW